jgi:hypothetical protein
LRRRYTLQEGCAFAVMPHPDGRWEAETEHERQDYLRIKEEKDTSDYPRPLRRVYQNTFQVYMHTPRGAPCPLANIYMSEVAAGTLANVLARLCKAMLDVQRGNPPPGRSGTFPGHSRQLG